MVEPGFCLGFVPVAGLHVALSVWSLVDPSRVELGDRAAQRWERARDLASTDDAVAFLLDHGWPADYGVHAVLAGLGDLPLVLAVQLGLWLATLVALYGVLRSYLRIPQWAAGTAVAVYALLPSNVHQPHTIVTEAFFIPAVAVLVLLIMDVAASKRLSSARAFALGWVAAVAVAFRAVFLPVLPAVCVCLAGMKLSPARRLLLANAIAVAPLFTWGCVQQAHGHAWQLGGAGFSLEENLAGRMRRMQAIGGAAVPAGFQQEAGVGSYLLYALQNPQPFARAVGRDLLMLIVNPGVNHGYGTFLERFDRSEGPEYWMHRLDEVDLGTVGVEIARAGPSRLAWNAFGLAAWGVFCIIALVGLMDLLRGPRKALAATLCVLVATLAMAGLAAHGVRFTLRSPMEFVLACFFAVGLCAVPAARGSRAPE